MPVVFEENRGQWETAANLVGRGHGAVVTFEPSTIRIGLLAKQNGTTPSPAVGIALRFTGGKSTLPRGERPLKGVHHYLRGTDATKWYTNIPLFEHVSYDELYPGVSIVVGDRDGKFEYDLHLSDAASLAQVRVDCEGVDSVEVGNSGELRIHTVAGTLCQTAPRSWYVEADGTETKADCRFRTLGPRAYGFENFDPKVGKRLIVDPGLDWSTFFGGTSDEVIRAIDLRSGLVTVAGGTFSTGLPTTPGAYQTYNVLGEDAFVARFNPSLSGPAQLVWATYLGGNGDDDAHGVSVSTNGFVSLCGRTTSSNFPVTASAAQPAPLGGVGQVNAFVSRLDLNGANLVYSTYFGGNNSPWGFGAATYANAIVVNANSLMTFVGYTETSDMALVNAYDTDFGGSFSSYGGDAFVAQINPTLSGATSLVYSTYVGGSLSTGSATFYDEAYAVDVDSGNIYLGGSTTSFLDFHTTIGALQPTAPSAGSAWWLDCFVTVLNPNAPPLSQLQYATYLGGPRDDQLFGLVAPNGVINCCGYTNSGSGSSASGLPGDFPTSNIAGRAFPGGAADAMDAGLGGSTDAFLIQLDYTSSIQQLRYGTFLGGTGAEIAWAIARVTDECDLIVGSTQTGSSSNNFPTTFGAYDTLWGGPGTDAFLTRINWTGAKPILQQLDYSTYLGGNSGVDVANCVVVDGNNNAYVGGQTMSPDFPTTTNAYDQSWNGTASGGTSWGDGFVLKFSLPGVLQ